MMKGVVWVWNEFVRWGINEFTCVGQRSVGVFHRFYGVFATIVVSRHGGVVATARGLRIDSGFGQGATAVVKRQHPTA